MNNKQTKEEKEEKKDEEILEEETPKEEESEECAEVENLEEEISTQDEEIIRLNKEMETLKDLLQRRQADFENFKKRTARLQEEFKKVAIKDFACDIININDDLIRAIDASNNFSMEDNEGSHSSFADGVKIISKRIEETLGKYGIEEIDAENQPFDPNFHEAVEIEMSEDADTDTVAKVHQKGFKIEDMVLRSAKVKVAKAAVKDKDQE